MNKTILTLFIFISLSSIAQTNKITIGIFPVINAAHYDPTKKADYKGGLTYLLDPVTCANYIGDIMTSAFVKSNKFIIVDRTKFLEIKKEKELQKSEDFIDGKTIEQCKNLGVEYLLFCKFIDLSFEPFTYAYYLYTFSIQIIKVETGEIVNSEIFNKIGGKKIEKTITKFIDKQFPK